MVFLQFEKKKEKEKAIPKHWIQNKKQKNTTHPVVAKSRSNYYSKQF